jgi:hypothetical protein
MENIGKIPVAEYENQASGDGIRTGGIDMADVSEDTAKSGRQVGR